MPILHVTRGVTRWTTRTTAEPPPVLASLQCSGDLGPVLANPAHCDDEERYGDVHWDVWDLAGCSLATCVFRGKANADFGGKRTLISDSAERGFRLMANTGFGRRR